MTPHKDTIPWDQKTQEEKAKAVCDHLVQEHLAGNLRPVSENPAAAGTKPPKPPKPPTPKPPTPTPTGA